MATIKSLGCKTFYSACSFHVFLSHEAADRQESTEQMFTYWLGTYVNSVFYKVSLSCPARLILTEAPCEHQENKCPLKSPLYCVLWYALYSSCMITTRSSFLLSLARGIRISKANSFQSIVLLNGKDGDSVFLCVISLWFGSVLCLTYSPFFCYACSCCCCGSSCLWGCHGGGCLVATELSILTGMLMRSG